MKAVVVEIKNKYTALLLEDGKIEKVKSENYTIGEVIEMKEKKTEGNTKLRRMITLASSAAAFIVLCGLGVWAYVAPYSYVSMDVNPSIKFMVNRLGYVISAEAVNEDGEDIIEGLDFSSLSNLPIEEALELAIEEVEKQGYFVGDEAGMIITTANQNEGEAQELLLKLQVMAQEQVREDGYEVEVEGLAVGLARVEEAEALGITPGKLNLIEKLSESSENPEEIDIEEWKNSSVKDIMKAINDNKDKTKEKDKSNNGNKENTEPEEEKNAEKNEEKNEVYLDDENDDDGEKETNFEYNGNNKSDLKKNNSGNGNEDEDEEDDDDED